MADTEIKNSQDVDNQNPENDIKEILNSYDVNIKNEEDLIEKDNLQEKKEKKSKIGEDWNLTEGILEDKEYKPKTIIDIDKYWNFNGYINPKIDVEFYVGAKNKTTGKIEGKWININALNDDLVYKDKEDNEYRHIANNNNYIVSANITDYGPKELELILYDRNFTDLQRLISSSISFVDETLEKDETTDINFEAEVQEGSGIKFLTSPAKITTNIRLRYGYNEDRNSKVYKENNYSGVNDGYYSVLGKNEAYRWNSVTKNLEVNGKTNQSLKTDSVLTNQYQQATLFSNWQYFVIVGLGSNLTNTGIKYTIKGISTEEFALNGYKMYQQYSVIKGKPKTIMSTLMNMFNTVETSPIRLVWADENIKAEEAPINGEEVLIDYESGEYKIVNEKEIEDIRKKIAEPLEDVQEYIKMLTDIKACFVNIEENNLKSYVDGKDMEYNNNIEKVVDCGKFGELTEEAPEREFIDFAMWPLYGDPDHQDYKLTANPGYNNNLLKMAMYQKEVSKNINYLKNLKGRLNKNGGNDRPCVVSVKNIVKIWLANIAIQAYGLDKIESVTSISALREREEEAEREEAEVGQAHLYLKDDIEYLNSPLPIKWYIDCPESSKKILEDKLNNDKYYIPSDDKIMYGTETFKAEDLKNEAFLQRLDSFEAMSNYIHKIKLTGLDNYCEKIGLSNDSDYALKLMKNYCHNKIVNDIFFFKSSFNILNEIFDTAEWFNEGTVINIRNAFNFFKKNTIYKYEYNGSNQEYNIYNAIEAIGQNEIGIENSKYEILTKILNSFSSSCEFIEEKKLGNKIEYEYVYNNKVTSKMIFEKVGDKYITNGFNIEDITVDKISFRKSITGETIFTLNFDENNRFVGKMKKVNYSTESEEEELKIKKEEIVIFIKFILSFALDILNKNKTLSLLIKKVEEGVEKTTIEHLQIFDNGEEFGNLKTPLPLSKEALNVNNEYYNFLSGVKKILDSNYNNKNIKKLYSEFKSSNGTYIKEKQEIRRMETRDILENFLAEIDKDKRKIDIISLKINESEEERFGDLDNGENLLEKAFEIVSKLLPISTEKNSNKKNISEFIKKIDSKLKKLQESFQHLENKSKRVNESNAGKEIELSLGSQDSRTTYDNNKRMTKTIASLLNDFCSQCMPKISSKELVIKNAGKYKDNNNKIENKFTIKDENGDDKVVEIYQNIPRYNLTWGVVGYYKDKPIIGFYYKEPRKINMLRRYNWGTGNNKMHCVKSFNVSTGSEFALLHAYNIVTDTSDGQIITAVDNNKILREVKNILPSKKPCFFNQAFDTNRDKNIFNNMINSLSKGTMTILGDPSLRFSGSIQPYTYPIYININLSREMPVWMKDDMSIVEEDNTEFSQLSGYYVITKISHSISNSGYLTTLEIMKYPGTGDAFETY